jgi:hypothetical protein
MSYVEECAKHGQYHADYICGDCVEDLRAENARLGAALQRIATPKRPDGSYNLSREACERLAREALEAK